MARTKQTVRKSTGSVAPRKPLLKPSSYRHASQRRQSVSSELLIPWREKASVKNVPTVGRGAHANLSRYAINVDRRSFYEDVDLSRAATCLLLQAAEQSTAPSVTLVQEDSNSNSVVNMPIFDLQSVGTRNYKGPLDQYIVSRQPIVLRRHQSVNVPAMEFLEHVIDQAFIKYGEKSTWVLLWEDEKGKVSMLAQEECNDDEYAELEQTLATGKLHGCALRGNDATAQLGLVSNQHLTEHTFVAVECSVLWSEDRHDSLVTKAGDPLLGLASSYIPARLLKPLSLAENWNLYKSECKSDNNSGSTRIPGFVFDSLTHGNETRYIDDPGWLFMTSSLTNSQGTNMPKYNLGAVCILDLKRKMITVGYETLHDVPSGTELTMNWGCWESISEHTLPGQAFLMTVVAKRLEALKSVARHQNVRIDQIAHHIPKDTEPFFYDPKQNVFKTLNRAGTEGGTDNGEYNGINYSVGIKLMGPKLKLLQYLRRKENPPRSLFSTDNDEWCEAIQSGDDCFNTASALFAVRPNDDNETLSQSTRFKMSKVPDEANTDFDQRLGPDDMSLKDVLRENYKHGVEVVKITDPSNPANLFAIPGEQPPLGLRAKKIFKEGYPIVAYGGIIKQLDPSTDRNGYCYDVHMPDEYEGPSLFIDGTDSIGGKINDPWTPDGFPLRKANVRAFEHWDVVTKTPQLVFYATTQIDEGDELLYDYGKPYWKVMFIELIRRQAEYARNEFTKCQATRKLIAEMLRKTVKDVVDLEEKELRRR